MTVKSVYDPKTMLSTKRKQLFSIEVAFCIGVTVWAEVGFSNRNKEHPPSYSTTEDQMVWTSHKTANIPPSSTCIQHKIQWPQSKRTTPKDLD